MTQAIGGFVSTWSSAYSSTMNRVELRNVRQGGNDFLSAAPLTLQSMWAGSLMATVAAAVTGPLAFIAQFFAIVFSPFVSFPLAVFSCASKEGFYEASVSSKADAMTKYYTWGDQVDQPSKGTVTLLVEGQERHFTLGEEISLWVEHTIEDGGKRYWFRQLRDGELFDDMCRRVEINGERVRIRLEEEATQKQYVEQKVGDERRKYFELGNEVEAPVQKTIMRFVDDEVQYYQLIEIDEQEEDCITMKSNEMTLFYDTGNELDAATDGSRSFVINGEVRHFASAKYVKRPSTGLAGWINQITDKFIHVSILPTRLSKWANEALALFNQYASDIVRISIVISGLALLYFGQTAMAAGALLAVSYEHLDHDLGLIPQTVSLFMEKWMPTLSMVGLFIVGSPLAQITAGVTLLLTIPEVQLFIHQKVAVFVREAMLAIAKSVFRFFFGEQRDESIDRMIEQAKAYPQLEEFDACLVRRRDLNAAEIDLILQARDDDYELNPASLTKNIEPALELEKNTNFNQLIELWDRVEEAWITPLGYNRILRRLSDDKRFILFLKQRFPEAKRFFFQPGGENFQAALDQYRLGIENWIQILAQEKGVTKEQFVAGWAKEQLQNYVNKTCGNRPIEGEQKYLRDAILNTSQILPFLLNPDINQVYLEDALIKLAIEGGDYCSLAMQRASNEVLQGFIDPLIEEREAHLEPNLRFEKLVLREFQRARLRAIQGFYQMVSSIFKRKEQTQDVADDVHLYTAITRSMKRGFYPLNEEEMNDFSLTELIFTESVLLPLRVELKKEFEIRIPAAMNLLGINPHNLFRNRILDYLRAWVDGNAQLSAEEKERLLAGDLAEENIADPDFYPKWNRLMLTILGIYRKKPAVREEAPAPLAVLAHA